MENCPCGSMQPFDSCCRPIIAGDKIADTPEQLMRSRYSAYTLADVEYIEKTMKEPANRNFVLNDARKWARKVKWLSLEVLNTVAGEDRGTVEFVAHYTQAQKRYRMHEISEFRRDDGIWYYVDGIIPVEKPVKKVPRNDLCLCGSGIKYKKCCGKN